MLAGNALAAAPGTTYPNPVEGDYVIKNFTFTSGETLPELRIHYHTLGDTQQRRQRHGAQRRSHRPWHGRQR